jgi:hypothetical protein
METGQLIVIGLSAAMLIWFLAAHQFNRQRGEAAERWIRTGLRQFGEIDASRHPGGSAVAGHFTIMRPQAPFRMLEVIFVLEGRENLPLWLVQRWQGRRDQLVIRSHLYSTPNFDLEIGHSKDQDFRMKVFEEKRRPFSLLPSQDGLEIAHRGHRDEQIVESLQQFIIENASMINRFSLTRKEPHLLIRASLGPLLSEKPADFFARLADLASLVK